MTAEIAQKVQEEFPEIADDYRSGAFYKDIASKYGIGTRYGLDANRAKSAVRHAIQGYTGGFGLAGFPGLIRDRKEKSRLATEHKKKMGNINAEYLMENKIGWHGLTPEERSAAGFKGGSITGPANVAKKRGFCGMSRKAKSIAGKKGGAKSRDLKLGINGLTREQKRHYGRERITLQGMVPWALEGPNGEPSEKQFLLNLAKKPKYILPQFKKRPRVDAVLIAKELNRVYHQGKPVRVRGAVSGMLYDLASGKTRPPEEFAEEE